MVTFYWFYGVSLLLVIAVFGIVIFYSWFFNFSDGVFLDVEKNEGSLGSMRVEGIIGDNL